MRSLYFEQDGLHPGLKHEDLPLASKGMLNTIDEEFDSEFVRAIQSLPWPDTEGVQVNTLQVDRGQWGGSQSICLRAN